MSLGFRDPLRLALLRKDFCKRGHDLNADNAQTPCGQCRRCRNAYMRVYNRDWRRKRKLTDAAERERRGRTADPETRAR